MPTDARARVEALAAKWLAENTYADDLTSLRVSLLADCLLAFAAAQRAEEREACIDVIREKGRQWHDAVPEDRPTLMGGLNSVVTSLRARREGPGLERLDTPSP